MKDSIQNAYKNIHAQDDLKEKTKIAVAKSLREDTGRYKEKDIRGDVPVKKRMGRHRSLVAAAACLAVVLTGCGAWTGYHTPTALISVDINPSLELGINCFDRVVSVTGYNEDGNELADELDVKYCNYEEAMCRLLEHGTVEQLMAEDGLLTIVVSGRNEEQCQRVRQTMDLCVEGQENAYCYHAGAEEVAQAHHLGMTCGRYRMYQILSELCPELTVEETCDMTMRQAYDRIQAELEEKKEIYGEMQGNLEDLWAQFGGHHGSGSGSGGGNGNGHHGGR